MRLVQKGFGLVEIMVGLVVGMLSMMVVLQVFNNAEARKRTVTGGADAQANGAIALFTIERDVKMAGWGMEAGGYAGCDTLHAYCDMSKDMAKCGGAGALETLSFAPLRIYDGGGNPDSITISYYADPHIGSFRMPARTTIRKSMPQPSSEVEVNNTAVCNDGDLMLVSQAGQCTLMQVTQVQPEASKLQHNPGASGVYNPPIKYQEDNGWPAYTKGANVSCFKAASNAPVYRKTYSVNTASSQLERSDNSQTPAAVNEQVMPDIIDMRAQYAIAQPNSQVINTWVDATKGSDGVDWGNPSPADWRRIKAVRVALLARSSQYERPADPAKGCTATTATQVKDWPAWAGFSTANLPADWGCYRYKAFETVIPLRNVIWGNL